VWSNDRAQRDYGALVISATQAAVARWLQSNLCYVKLNIACVPTSTILNMAHKVQEWSTRLHSENTIFHIKSIIYITKQFALTSAFNHALPCGRAHGAIGHWLVQQSSDVDEILHSDLRPKIVRQIWS
jgi:hypothetical protein